MMAVLLMICAFAVFFVVEDSFTSPRWRCLSELGLNPEGVDFSTGRVHGGCVESGWIGEVPMVSTYEQ